MAIKETHSSKLGTCTPPLRGGLPSVCRDHNIQSYFWPNVACTHTWAWHWNAAQSARGVFGQCHRNRYLLHVHCRFRRQPAGIMLCIVRRNDIKRSDQVLTYIHGVIAHLGSTVVARGKFIANPIFFIVSHTPQLLNYSVGYGVEIPFSSTTN